MSARVAKFKYIIEPDDVARTAALSTCQAKHSDAEVLPLYDPFFPGLMKMVKEFVPDGQAVWIGNVFCS